jgi:hypothetical protein
MRGNSHQKRISTILLWQGTIVLLVTPAAVELSVWIGLLGWGQPISMSVWRWGNHFSSGDEESCKFGFSS